MVAFADFYASDFSAGGLRQFIHKLYHARIFIRCCLTLDVVLKLDDEFFAGFVFPFPCKDDGGFHHLPAYGVGHTCDGAFHD